MKFVLVIIFFVFQNSGAKVNSKDISSVTKKSEKTYLKDLDLPLLKGSKIRVLNYNSQYKVYQVISVKHPAEGFSYTTLKFLGSSTKGLNIKSLKENPLNLIDQDLTLVKDLPTLHVPHDFEGQKNK